MRFHDARAVRITGREDGKNSKEADMRLVRILFLALVLIAITLPMYGCGNGGGTTGTLSGSGK